MKSARILIVLVVLCAAVLSMTGCQLIAQKAVEGATGVKVDQSGNGKDVTVTGKNGTASLSSQEGKLPDGLPSNVPAYDGTIKSSATLATDKGTNYTYTIETSDDIAAVQAWYKDQLTTKGWTVTGSVTGGTDSAMVSAKIGDTSNIVVTIGKNSDGKTEIAVITDVKK
jgi:hypothetical protein